MCMRSHFTMKNMWAAWLCTLLLLYQTTSCQSFVENLQLQSNGKLGLIVPLGVRHGMHRVRGRSLLRSGMMPVLGAIREGYFYAKLGLGTPPRTFSTIIDTGSTITYIPCANCRHCGNHMDPGFDPAQSSTAKVLGCDHQLCECGTPACTCIERKCYYSRRYAEMSSSEGWLVADKLTFPDNGTSLDFVFGCENKETGQIYQQSVDGVLGMGNNENSFTHQLARSGLVENVFSLCYGFPAGGSMLLGDVPLDPGIKLQYTPLIDRRLHYYNIDLRSISLNGKSLAVDRDDYGRGYGTVLDSGTTFTYLPSSAFNAFVAVLNQALKGKGLRQTSGADPQFNDICWRGAPHDFKGIEEFFPNGTISFAAGAKFQLTPQRYLFMVGRGEYCLGVFDNGYQGTLIGGIIVRNILVKYDKDGSRVGFAEADCNQIRLAPAATGEADWESPADSSPPPHATPDTAAAAAEGTQDREEGASASASAAAAAATDGDNGSGSDTHQQQSDRDKQPAQPDKQPQQQQQQQQHEQQNPSSGQQQQQQWSPKVDGTAQQTSWLMRSSRDWWLGFSAGGVVAAVTLLAAYLVASRRQKPTRNGGVNMRVMGFGSSNSSYRQVEEVNIDIETELTPLASIGVAGSSKV